MPNKNDKAMMKFWITCPGCKKKFGVEPILIMKYISRIIDRHKHKLAGIEEVLLSAQAEVEKKVGKKTEQKS